MRCRYANLLPFLGQAKAGLTRGVSFVELHKLYWGVESWTANFTTSFVVKANHDPTAILTTTIDLQNNTAKVLPPNMFSFDREFSEVHLVGPLLQRSSVSIQINDNYDPPLYDLESIKGSGETQTGSATLSPNPSKEDEEHGTPAHKSRRSSLFGVTLWGGPGYYYNPDEDICAPFLQIDGAACTSDFTSGLQPSLSFSIDKTSPDGTPNTVSPAMSVSVGDIDYGKVPLSAVSYSGGGSYNGTPFTATLQSFAASISLEPNSWFTYRGYDGVALYDGDTGDALINPKTGNQFTANELAAMDFP